MTASLDHTALIGTDLASPTLLVLSGPARGSRVEVPGGGLVFGRAADSMGRLGDDQTLSRWHARLESGGGGLVVEDLSSRNGTLLNGRRITGRQTLRPGDIVTLGASRLQALPANAHAPAQLGATAVLPAAHAVRSKATSADLIQSVTRLDRAIKDRRESDVELTNWWLATLLLSWVTFGIYALRSFFKRMSRIDAFSRRKRVYYESLLEWTQRKAAAAGEGDLVHNELLDLRDDVAHAYEHDLRPIEAGPSFILTIATIGIYGFFVLYRLNRYWCDAQDLEQDFTDRLSQMWIKLGIVRYPLSYRVDQSKRRSYPLNLLLSIVTLGIWGLVWDHKIHTDPDNLFREFHSVEDTVLQTIRSK
jgi:Inner membrane component of T3SS, cytoplasmic domain